jgi:hypothetical protein
MKKFTPRPAHAGLYRSVARLKKRTRMLAIFSRSRSAHLFSMRTNGLYLKLCGGPGLGGLSRRRAGLPGFYLQPLQAVSWSFFAFGGPARNQAVRRSPGSRAFAFDEGNRHLFVKLRLRIR